MTHEPYTKFKAWMMEHGVQAIEIADLLGIAKSSVSKRLNGTGADFTVAEVRAICLCYGISSDEYFVANKVS